MATPEEIKKQATERGKTTADIGDLEAQADTNDKKSALVQGLVEGMEQGRKKR